MSISVQCPGCDKQLKAKVELAGKRVKCPNCAQLVVVPSFCSASPTPTADPTKPSPRKSPPGGGREATASPAPQRRPVRWPWYAGGGAAFLCVLAVVISIFAMPAKDRTPAKNEMAAVTPPESKPKPEPAPEPKRKPEPKPEPAPKPPEERAASENKALDGNKAAAVRAVDVGSATPQHSSNVLVMKIGEKQYEPGAIFKIEPAKDEVIKGDCSLKFKCIRKTGQSAPSYGMCTVIFAKLETGEGQASMGRQYNVTKKDDGSIAVAPTYAWPAAQKETQLEFSVNLGTSSPFTPTTKYHGKGQIYFYLDDGEDKPLSNIISVETDIPR